MKRLLLSLLVATSAMAQTPSPNQRQPDVVDQLAAPLNPSYARIYKKIAGRELEMHVFNPDGFRPEDRRPCFLIIHGGGWAGGAPKRMYPFAAHYVRLGMVGISLQYRLYQPKGEVTVFDCVKDVRTALRYIHAHAAELGVDPGKIVVSGGSAGGHLAAATAMFDNINEEGEDGPISPAPRALVLLFPVIDTSEAGYGHAKIGERWRELSPLHQVRSGLPATLIFHGTADTVTPFAGAKAFQEAMIKVGNRCELDVYEGGTHGYLMRDAAVLADTFRKTDAFLKSLHLLP